MWSNTIYPPYFIDKGKEKVKYIDSNLSIDFMLKYYFGYSGLIEIYFLH